MRTILRKNCTGYYDVYNLNQMFGLPSEINKEEKLLVKREKTPLPSSSRLTRDVILKNPKPKRKIDVPKINFGDALLTHSACKIFDKSSEMRAKNYRYSP